MQYKILLLITLLSGCVHAMENDSNEQKFLSGLIEFIGKSTEYNNPYCTSAYEDLKKSALNPNHLIEDEGSFSILNAYGLIDTKNNTVKEHVRMLVKERVIELNSKKQKK